MKHKQDCKRKAYQLNKNEYSNEEALKVLQRENDAHIKKYGFVIHYVLPTEQSPWVDYHTHGLVESRSHMNLQIVLPIQPDIAHGILWSLVRLIDEKKNFQNNELVYDIIQGYPIKFKKIISDNEEILRILFPDPNGLFFGDLECDSFYAEQETAILQEEIRQLQ